MNRQSERYTIYDIRFTRAGAGKGMADCRLPILRGRAVPAPICAAADRSISLLKGGLSMKATSLNQGLTDVWLGKNPWSGQPKIHDADGAISR